ncbi:MAG: hypothetical protein MUP17_01330 [candidate division Zixibacteria bacterium]|nr:hypothetical protein [candidate division Zixibacteria bacterium]
MASNSLSDLVKVVLSFIRKNWLAPRGLLALLGIEVLLLPFLWQHFGVNSGVLKLIIAVVLILSSVSVWVIERRYPKNKRNKVGVVLAITTESKKEHLRLRSDLILGVKEVVRTKGKENILNVIEMPEYYASKIDDHPASLQALKKADAHFIIYGSCKQRLEKGTPHYFMALEATVIHKPIPKVISDLFAQEFSELFPRRVAFPIADEISGFEVTKEWIGFIARYIIGIAAFLSEGFDLALELFKELDLELEQIDVNLTQIRKVKARLPQRIAESSLAIANNKYLLYTKTKNIELLRQMKPLLDILKEMDPNNYVAHLLRGIYLFLVERNVEEAKKEIKKSKNTLDSTWRYSEAFLYAYENDLDKAESSYKKAFRDGVASGAILQAEDFINDVLEIEPDKWQLWYCVGMINWRAKEDKILGRQAFERFLEGGSDADFQEQKRKVREYLKSTKVENGEIPR